MPITCDKNGIIQLYPETKKDNAPKLKKDGTPKKTCQNKKKGEKSEVYALKVEDLKAILSYFEENQKWIHYLLFVLSGNMARRVGDMLSLKWKDIYNPCTGKIRENILSIKEKKTGKFANPKINSICREAITLYINKTGCDPSENNYNNPVFLQLNGTHSGKVITDDGYRKALKKAGEAVGIEYNIGTHSLRKAFGMLAIMAHPGDPYVMQTLQEILNHSNEKTTRNYTGLTQQIVDKFYDDTGELWSRYVIGEEEFKSISDTPIISLDANDLRDVIKIAYEAGMRNSKTVDAMTHINAITEIMEMIEQISK